MHRVFGFDVLACPRCGHAMRLIALIEQPEVIRRILRHLGHPLEVPAPAPARVPPFAAGLPPELETSLAPFRDARSASACPAAAELDVTITVRRQWFGFDHR